MARHQDMPRRLVTKHLEVLIRASESRGYRAKIGVFKILDIYILDDDTQIQKDEPVSDIEQYIFKPDEEEIRVEV